MAEEHPIGWWVKRLDTLLDEAVDSVVAGEGLTRRHWQVLHTLHAGVEQEDEVLADVAPFGDASAVLAHLADRGWIDRPRVGVLRLTPEGTAAHDRVSRAVGRVRRHTADGLSRQEYERTVLVLARMVENVERALGRG